ncbi:OmpH family outer membrane protein [Pelobacter propionicus]|uniref:Outer membrane chaperone Skp (OmpH) n=1 Tax=Pelobacter propionicus (strain DSM 2379 / NBRC 103807 / OttBd1) TaxID=338966 RepID=A1ATE5_PELPD|nr:OmpH family outer membrane protein [Pelobacter propionicus]ABL00616.1 outer membrane chaperone Skp (OmpH) [Pelobacter propionicus DSM 2379]
MKRLILAVILLGCITTGAAFAAEAKNAAKIGYIDMQRAINTSDSGKQAKEQLAARLKKYQDEINSRQNELKRLKEDLEKQGMLLSEAARSAKEKDYQQKLKEFQRFTKDAQEELQAKDEELTRKILEGMEKVIQEFGKNNGYTFIFVRNESMLFADDKADLTEEVLKLYNATHKK